MKTIYAQLNHEAKVWWYHAELRRRGKTQEGRRRERESIRGSVALLRGLLGTRGHLQWGKDGCYHSSEIPTKDGSYTQHLGGYRSGQDTVEAARRLGIPIVGEERQP